MVVEKGTSQWHCKGEGKQPSKVGKGVPVEQVKGKR